ncbi:MAG: DUF2147 domain-containing protein [Saprospiraceae bacterium]|nr:DUF2147 domain-containing protein [Saprospiraceae bacterium]
MKNYILTVLSLFLLHSSIQAQSLTGTWKTIDDETNKPKSHVEIYQTGNSYHGKVTKLLADATTSKCDKCSGDRHNKPIQGMVILENMKLDDGELQDGKILDPKNGKWYTCKMWLKEGDPNVLVVRGYVFGFYRTQYWYRVK